MRSTRLTRTSAVMLGVALVAAVAALPAVASPPSVGANVDWPLYGNTFSNDRFQNIDQVDPSNVSALRPAWVFHTGVLDHEASLEASPIVVDGTMYVTTGHDDVFALDAATGTQRWAYHPESQMPPLDSIDLCCGRNNRGVAVDDGKVFLGRLDDVVVALSATDGHVLWQRTIANIDGGFSITMAPQVVDGMVIVGTAGGEFDIRGNVVALDADTGRTVWTFRTTKPGRTWARNSWKQGGAPVWQTSAVDLAHGLLYVTVGNASPDLNGNLRAGSNLYTDSVVALQLRTGHVAWFFQEVHHDVWDYDPASPPILFDVTRGDRSIPALAECGKNGQTYILNRLDGTPVFPVVEQKVPSQNPSWQHAWPTQPISSVQSLVPLHTISPPSEGLQVAPQYTPPRPTPLVMTPGSDGGCEWPPGAYSPRTRYLYFGQRYEPQIFEAHKGSTTGIGSTFTGNVPGVDDFGVFGAISTQTGRAVWKIRVPGPAKSGLVVAGDVVFFGENDGMFHAVDARTGQMLWSFDGTSIPHGGGANAAPIAYTVGGTEFIADGFGGNVPDREIEGSPVGDAIVAFALPNAS